jgi:tape measure domain-containing protein
MASNTLEYQLKILTDTITGSLNKVQSQINNVKADIKINIYSDNSSVKKALKDVEDSARNTGDSARSSLSRIFEIAGGNLLADGIRSSLSGVKEAIINEFNVAGDLQKTRNALNGILGGGVEGAKAGGQVIKDVIKLAAETPFNIPELTTTTQQLAAVGISTGALVPTLKVLGDVAAGTGRPLSQIAYVYGQIKVANKAYSQDLNQLQNAGIPIIQKLAATYGTTQDEVKKLASNGKVSFDDVDKEIKKLTASGGIFYNQMVILSSTLPGRLETLQDTFGQLFRTVIGITDEIDIIPGGLFDVVSSSIQGLINLLNSEAGSQFANSLKSGIGGVITQVSNLKSGFEQALNFINTGKITPQLFNVQEGSTGGDLYIKTLSTIRSVIEFVKKSIEDFSGSLEKVRGADNYKFLTDLVNGFKNLGGELLGGGIVALLGGLALALGSIAFSAILAAAPFILLAGAIVLIGKAFGSLDLKSVSNAFTPIKNGFNDLLARLNTPEFKVFKAQFITAFQAIQAAITPILQILGGLFLIIVGNIISFGGYVFNTLYPVILQMSAAFYGLQAALAPVYVAIVAVVAVIIITLLPVFQIIGAVITQLLATVIRIITDIIAIFTGFVNIVVGLFTGDFNKVKEGFGQVLGGLSKIVEDVKGGVFNSVKAVVDGIVNFFTGINLAIAMKNAIDGLINFISGSASRVANAFSELFSNIKIPEIKIPGFATGVRNLDFTQLAEVAERGRELIQYKSGLTELVNTRQTRILPKGTNVYNNSDTENILRNQKQGQYSNSTTNNSSQVANNQVYVNNYSSNYNQFSLSPYLRGSSNI